MTRQISYYIIFATHEQKKNFINCAKFWRSPELKVHVQQVHIYLKPKSRAYANYKEKKSERQSSIYLSLPVWEFEHGKLKLYPIWKVPMNKVKDNCIHLLSDIEKWIQAEDFSVSIYQISQVAIDEFIDWSWTFFENKLVDKTQN